MEQLSVAEDKLSKVMARLLGVDVFAKKMEMDEERFVPEGLGYKTDLFEEEEKVRAARKCLRSMFLSRKRKTLRVDLRRRRFLLAAISKDNPISFWTPKAEARGEGERDDLFCILDILYTISVAVRQSPVWSVSNVPVCNYVKSCLFISLQLFY